MNNKAFRKNSDSSSALNSLLNLNSFWHVIWDFPFSGIPDPCFRPPVCSRVKALTDAVATRAIQQEPGFTDALEAAVVVDAHPIQTDVPNPALVHIWAQSTHRSRDRGIKHTSCQYVWPLHKQITTQLHNSIPFLSNTIELSLKRGSEEGSLKDPFIYLFFNNVLLLKNFNFF